MTQHDAPAQDEPRTPMWLTALGAVLMLVVAIWWLSPAHESADATIRVPAASAAGAVPEGTDARPEAPTIRVPAREEDQVRRPLPTSPTKRAGSPTILRPSLRVPPPGPPGNAQP